MRITKQQLQNLVKSMAKQERACELLADEATDDTYRKYFKGRAYTYRVLIPVVKALYEKPTNTNQT